MLWGREDDLTDSGLWQMSVCGISDVEHSGSDTWQELVVSY